MAARTLLITRDALLARLRVHWRAKGLRFRVATSRPLRERYGSWVALAADGTVARSARADGHPDESLETLAERLQLIERWEVHDSDVEPY